MRNANKTISTISLTLCLLIAFLLPVQVYAETLDSQNKDEVAANFNNISSDINEIGNIVSEITNERTEYSKTFLLDDGTKMLAQYSEPVHYKNSKGYWVQYDNTLVESESNATSDEANISDEYTNKKSNIDITLSKSVSDTEMIKVQSNDYSVSWGYNDANDSQINIVNDDEKLSGNDKFTSLNNLTSEAKYEDVYKNVDIQYYLSPTGVKENIILKDATVQNVFNVTYSIGTLTPKQTDENTITLYDDKNTIAYTIDAPYMIDKNGATSTKLKLKIINHKNSELNVELTADSSFINSSERNFPITIDPELETPQKSNYSFTGFVNGKAISYAPYYLTTNAYWMWKFTKLPTLDNSARITKATFCMDIQNGENTFSNDNEAIIVNLHKATTSSPYYNSEIEDYCAVTKNKCDKIEFDITNLMKGWIDGSIVNNGFVFEAKNSIGSKKLNLASGGNGYNYPTYTIVYKDFSGLEDSLSYHTVSAGSNAEISVSDYLGNLTVTQDLYESTTARMPMSISATYNGFNYEEENENNTIGYGWHFSFDQYIEETNSTLTNAGYEYVYTDGDGTKHYLVKTVDESNNESWEDEDDLGLTLTKDSNFFYLNDGSKTKKFRLISSKQNFVYEYENDYTKNNITYNKSSTGGINYIYNSNGQSFSISKTTINNKSYITSLNLPNSEKVYFTYSQENDKVLLTKVKLADGTCSNYSYDSSGRLSSVQYSNESDNSVKYGNTITTTYNTNGKISNITEKSSENTTGNYLNFTYGTNNTTTVKDRNGNSEMYTFDNEGNKISTLNANGSVSTGSSSDLSVSAGSDSFIKNYITESSDFTDIDIGSNSYYYESNSNGTTSIDESETYFGEKSLRIDNNSNSTITSISHKFDETSFNGKDITFSAYVKTTTLKTGSSPAGAILSIKCYNSDNEITKEENSFSIDNAENWQRFSVTASVPAATSYVEISCSVKNAKGTAWFDCLQLEEGNCVNDYNALQNANFEVKKYWKNENGNEQYVSNNTSTIYGVAGISNTSDDSNESDEDDIETTESDNSNQQPTTVVFEHDNVDTTDAYGNVVKSAEGEYKRVYYYNPTSNTSTTVTPTTNTTVVSSTEPSSNTGNSTEENKVNFDSNKYVYQEVNVNKAGVSFNISGKAKAKSVPITDEERTFGIALNIYYKDKSTPESHYQEFNSATTAQQTVTMAVTPDDDNSIIEKVAFAFVYGYNSNSMTLYNAMLNISVDGTSDTSTSNTNNASDDDIEYGDLISETLDKSQPYIQTSSQYDSNGNYITSETDELGNITKYTYDAKGNKTSTTDGNGNVVNYTYNSSNNVTSVASGDAENNYSYDYLGNVSLITHNNFSYKFNYNEFNKLVETIIGDTTVLSDTYNSNNGNLTKTTYANGDYIKYTYDKYNNITQIDGKNGTIANLIYNKKGLISICNDYESGETTYYYYDFNGTVQGQYIQSDNGNLSKYTGYDETGNSVEKVSVGNSTRTISTGTDKDGNSTLNYDGLHSESTTDDFGRTTEKKSYISLSKGEFVTEYGYDGANDENDKYTSNTVKTLTQKFDENSLVNYEYSYDKNGNITEIKQDGNVTNTYKYDSLNQLTEEYNYLDKFYINYSYDQNGNIHSMNRQYLNSDNQPSGKPTGNVYYYDDTEWCDKLTKLNSYNITYDAVGNPLNYRDGISFTWKNGRWLSSTTLNDGTKVTYQYNLNGMRTQKTVGNKTTNYYYDSNNNLIGLVSYKNNKIDNVLFFYYDSDNSPISLKYNNTMYYYVKNIQGDIVKIIDENGTEVAGYVYDAWGNTLTTTGDTTLGSLNPLRYRGYVYDDETGLYYLQSRYYDPQTGRFINADDTAYIGATGTVLSTNLFTYCENNTIYYCDSNGNFSFKIGIRWIVRLLSCNEFSLTVTNSNNKNIKKLFNIAGFYRDKKGVYHARQDCLQQYGGYNSFYDIIFNLCTTMKAVKFPFTCSANGKEYIFWAWKGDYLNLGAGAELGFYKRLVIGDYKTDHWIVDQNFKFKMSMRLKYNGKTIINYAPKKYKWWLTGFNPKYQNININKLKVKFVVHFDNHKNIFRSFYRICKKNSLWKFNYKKYKAVLRF
jgi:RHS repeat-associated protein